ncbi:hypothetical protein RHSIM_Rhsim08G0215100 [Rhododendron simsii]|uniref:Pentatricopeptide repeat-containing protein n=1 Tax=Rhododendron simsii TaxID=118357 RepID=A0A834GM53_RHOSS|nr:hypothetical protein RHSIM_Rhsim08G0215100 [Rhododendron simsii]
MSWYAFGPELWALNLAYSRANLPANAIRAFSKTADFGVGFGNDDVDKLLYELCKRKQVRHAQGFFDRVKFEVEHSAKSYSILMRGWGDIGESGEVRKVFDQMLERGCCVDLFAYNSMLQSLCKGGSVEEAYKLFCEMGSKGLEPDGFTYSIFIHAACDANDIHSAFRVLDRMKRYELVPNVYTYNAIIKRLCKNDRVEEAYLLLDEMIERGETPDVWSYNTILACHCDHNEVNKTLISRMDQDSHLPDWHTYNMVIKMLIRIGRFNRVTKVWESMEEREFYPSASTYAVMVHGLCKKKGKDACRYFEIMVDEGIPYSSTCEMLRNRLIGLGFSEQTHILANKMERSISCSIQELSDIMRVPGIFGMRYLKFGRNKVTKLLQSEITLYCLVDMLAHASSEPTDSSSRPAATRVLNPQKKPITFSAYSRANLPANAIRAFSKTADFGVGFGNDDVDKLLYELCKRKQVRHAQGFFDRVKFEVEHSAKSYSILMRGWGDIGESGEVRKVFDQMLERGCCVDLFAYNSMLQSLCKGGSVEEAYKLFCEMGSKGLEPDGFTYSIFIHAACDANDIHSVFRVLDRMKRYELVPNVYTYNAIIKRLCKNDRVEEAYLLLDEMIERGETPDVWSYNTILACHCDHNEVNKTLISRMDQDSHLPDWHTYNMVIKMLIRIGRFNRVTKVWESMEEREFYPSASTYAVMVHGLCKKKGKDACRYFEIMVDEGIPYSSTCEMLRNRLIGLGFSEQTHILANKMERSISCSIQELSDIMRGERGGAGLRRDRESSDDSDE